MMKLIHLALYAKGHYKRTDIWEDLKQCLRAHDYEPDTHSDVLGIIQARVTEYVLKQYSDAATACANVAEDIAIEFGYWFCTQGSRELIDIINQDKSDITNTKKVYKKFITEVYGKNK